MRPAVRIACHPLSVCLDLGHDAAISAPADCVNQATPAIVAERGAQRLPRLALLLFCAAYVIPGVFGRDPWRNADLTAYGFMAKIAAGLSPWHHPELGGITTDGGLLPYWVGALFIKLLPMLDPALAARIPFALILVCVIALVWYSSFHLARTDAAQPVAFAFGGEAQAVDYARALADGALLALVASLGLLLLGHETTPELLQLLGMALFVYGLAASPFRALKARLAMLLSLPVLAASAAPAVALMLGLGGALICWRSAYEPVRASTGWMLAGTALSAWVAWLLGSWAWRLQALPGADFPLRVGTLLLWFAWPVWPQALWSLWRWRAYLLRRHVSVPLLAVLVSLLSCLTMGGSDRALMLGLPALAVLASFALPTFSRSVSAMLDWFSMFFFSAIALFIWLYYLSMQTGWPPQPLANVRELAQGFEPSFHPLALLFALLGTAAWLGLLRWRTARHQHALWKSMVLPSGGVALAWLLAMTLWLPVLDYARSHRPLIERLARVMPANGSCIATPGQALSLVAALEVQGHWKVDALRSAAETRCPLLLVQSDDAVAAAPGPDWMPLASVKRPTDRSQSYRLYQRQP